MADPQLPTSANRKNYSRAVPPVTSDKANVPDGPLDTAFLDVMRNAPQFTALAEINHHKDVLQFTEFLKRDETLNVLQATNTKHIFLERPPQFQRHADDLASGKISKSEFVDRMSALKIISAKNDQEGKKIHENTADMILGAQKRGIKVHFSDNNSLANLDMQHPELKKYQEEIMQKMDEKVKADPEKYKNMTFDQQVEDGKKFGLDYFNRLPKARQEQLSELMMQERLGTDKSIAKDMKKTAGNDRAVIYYGNYHIEGFEGEIGADNMKKIILVGKGVPEGTQMPEGWSTFKIPQQQAEAVPSKVQYRAPSPDRP